jgi:hypothetical protein
MTCFSLALTTRRSQISARLCWPTPLELEGVRSVGAVKRVSIPVGRGSSGICPYRRGSMPRGRSRCGPVGRTSEAAVFAAGCPEISPLLARQIGRAASPRPPFPRGRLLTKARALFSPSRSEICPTMYSTGLALRPKRWRTPVKTPSLARNIDVFLDEVPNGGCYN